MNFPLPFPSFQYRQAANRLSPPTSPYSPLPRSNPVYNCRDIALNNNKLSMNYVNYIMSPMPQMGALGLQNVMFDPVACYPSYPVVFVIPQPVLEQGYPQNDSEEEYEKGRASEPTGQIKMEDIKTTSEGSANSLSFPLKVQRIERRSSEHRGRKKTRNHPTSKEESEWTQGSQGQASSAVDCPRKFHNIKKKKYKQNASRNILTNIGNQLITFLCSPKKSRKVLVSAFPDLSEQTIKQFYEYTAGLRRQTDYYLNISKLKKFWRGSDQDLSKFVRILSVYYLRWIIPLSILTSKKMSTTSRMFHSQARKYLLTEIRTLD